MAGDAFGIALELKLATKYLSFNGCCLNCGLIIIIIILSPPTRGHSKTAVVQRMLGYPPSAAVDCG